MLRTDQYRLQYLGYLRKAGKPISRDEVRKKANDGVGFSFDSQQPILQDLSRRGWIRFLGDNRRVIITMEGRAAYSKLSKLFD